MPPVEFSAEWNASCAHRPVSVRNDTEVASEFFSFNYFVIAFVAVYYPVFVFLFWLARRYQTGAYLAKRSFLAIICQAIGAFAITGVGPIRDVVGRQEFNCSMTLWFRIIGVMNVILPVLIKLNFFRNQMLWSKAMKSISFQKLQEMISQDIPGVSSPNVTSTPRKSLFSFSTRTSLPRSSKDVTDLESHDEHSSQASGARQGLSSGFAASSAIGSDEFSKLLYQQSIRYNLMTIVGPMMPLVITGLVLEFSLPYYRYNCNGCFEETWFQVVIAVCVNFLFLPSSYFAYVLRNAPDPLGMLTELKMMIIFASGPALVGLIGSIADEHIGRPFDRGIFSWDWLIILGLIFQFFWICPQPLFVSTRINRKVAGAQIDFKSFLSNPRALKLFSEHLANEWAVENIKFWSQVETFRGQYNTFKTNRDCNIVAWQTYCTFIRPGAVLDINIPSSLREKLIETFENLIKNDTDLSFEKVPQSIFDDAQHEVFNLMEKDAFQRFQRTDAYKNFIGDNTVLDTASHKVVVVADPGNQ